MPRRTSNGSYAAVAETAPPLPGAIVSGHIGCNVTEEVKALRGVRARLPPDVSPRPARRHLISMTSGDIAEVWYSISLITYQRDLVPFLRLARFLAVTMGTRLWGATALGKSLPVDQRRGRGALSRPDPVPRAL